MDVLEQANDLMREAMAEMAKADPSQKQRRAS